MIAPRLILSEPLREIRPGSRLKTVALILLVVAASFLNSATVQAGDSDIEIKMSLSEPHIRLGEQTTLTVSVTGPSGFSEPVLPETDDLDITLRGRTQSVQILNTTVTSSKIFSYAVIPHKEGDFTIGPAKIERRGQTYESGTVSLSVTESKEEPATAKDDQSKGVIAEASVDKVNPYVGQQVTLLFRFARRADARIRNAGYQMPDLSDFWVEGTENKQEYRQVINGTEYAVTQIAVPLFPTREGKITIGEITIQYDEAVASQQSRPFGASPFDDDFFGFFRSERLVSRVRRLKPIVINVRPLPTADRPGNYKGGVGSFSVSSRLSDNKVNVGESVTLTVVVSGQGNIRDLADPKLNIKDVKIYSDVPTTDVKNFDDKIVGEKTYKLALVPQEAGEIEIPDVSVPYFNPKSGRYEVASSTPLTLKVLPSSEKTTFVAPTGNQPTTGAAPKAGDILPIHERIGSIKAGFHRVWLYRLRPVAYALPTILYALCLVYARHSERLKTDTAYRRRRFASRIAATHVKNAEHAMASREWEKVFTECSRAVTEYLADKFNVPARGLTPSDIGTRLSGRGIDDSFLKEILKFLEGCDFGRFASSNQHAGMAVNCIERTHDILERLESQRTINP